VHRALLPEEAADFEIAADERVEHLRELRADDPHALLDEGHDFGAALVARENL